MSVPICGPCAKSRGVLPSSAFAQFPESARCGYCGLVSPCVPLRSRDLARIVMHSMTPAPFARVIGEAAE